MLERDYIEEILGRFAAAIQEKLSGAKVSEETLVLCEADIAELLSLSPATAMSLDNFSLCTMMDLSGIGASVAEAAADAFEAISQKYAELGEADLAANRLDKALAIRAHYQLD